MTIFKYISKQIASIKEAMAVVTGNEQYDNGYNLAAQHHLRSLHTIRDLLEKEQFETFIPPDRCLDEEDIPF